MCCAELGIDCSSIKDVLVLVISIWYFPDTPRSQFIALLQKLKFIFTCQRLMILLWYTVNRCKKSNVDTPKNELHFYCYFPESLQKWVYLPQAHRTMKLVQNQTNKEKVKCVIKCQIFGCESVRVSPCPHNLERIHSHTSTRMERQNKI